jgi:hypothetical protein
MELRPKECDRLNGEQVAAVSRPQARSPVAIIGSTLRTLYLLAAVLYTFWHLLTSQSSWKANTFSQSLGSSSASAVVDGNPRTAVSHPNGVEETPAPVLSWSEWGKLHGVEWNKDVISWDKHGRTSEQENSTLTTTEDYFLSKAFGESLQPSKVIPYYYRATNSIPKEDITITTLVTSDRFKVLAALVQKYQGQWLPKYSPAPPYSASDKLSIQVPFLYLYT